MLRTKLNGIADQVRPDVQHQRFRPTPRHFRQIGIKVKLFRRPLCFQQHNCLTNLLVQPIACLLHRHRVIADLAEQQNVAHQRGQTPRVEQNPLDIPRLLRRNIRALQQRRVALDSAHRGFDFMRYVRHKVGLQRLRFAQRLHHPVEAVIAVRNFVDDAVRRQADGEIPAGNLLHGAAQPYNRTQQQHVHHRRRRQPNRRAKEKQPYQWMYFNRLVQQVFQQRREQRCNQQRTENLCNRRQGKQHANIQLAAPLLLLLHALTTL